MGRLESTVMEIVWASGESSVHDVMERMERPLAYTTIMTTLDRLYKKGLLLRHKVDRAFVYAPRFTRQEWGRKRAGDFLPSSWRHPRLSGTCSFPAWWTPSVNQTPRCSTSSSAKCTTTRPSLTGGTERRDNPLLPRL